MSDLSSPIWRDYYRNLAKAFSAGVRRYQLFSASHDAQIMDVKAFTAYQGACKATIAHLDALLKLLNQLSQDDRVAQPCTQDDPEQKGIELLLAQARSELNTLQINTETPLRMKEHQEDE